MSAKESWVSTVLLNFVLKEEKEMKLHLKTLGMWTILLAISQT